MPQRAGRLVVVLALASSSLTACDGEITGLDPALAATCGATGRLHAGVVGDETWAPAGNPHAVVDTLRVAGILTLEPGVVVCVEPGVPILIGQDGAALHASGTADAPILFTAGDPDRPWGGIIAPKDCHSPSWTTPTEPTEPCSAGETTIAHARIEHAEYGIRAGARARVEHTHFRQIRCTAAAVSYLAHSRVDSAGMEGCPAVAMGVAASFGGTEQFEDNVIMGAGADGLGFWGYMISTSGTVPGSVALLGGRIEDSGGVGLAFSSHYHVPVVTESRPLRITGGAGVPVRGMLADVMKIWPTAAAQDSLRGNAGDTLVVWGGIEGQGVVVASGLTLKNAGHFLLPFPTIASPDGLRIEPGGAATGEIRILGPLRAEGTAGAPARVAGADIFLLCEEPSVARCDVGSSLAHTVLENVRLLASTQRVQIEAVRAYASRLAVGPGSVLDDVTVEDSPGDAIDAAPDVAISRCEIRGSATAGILIRGTDVGEVTIRNCALESNGGPGVLNASVVPVDARFNWWGDPAGPFGPAGDGVEGNVDYSDYLSTPPPGILTGAPGFGVN